MSEVSIIGLDIAKHVFQAHGVDAAGHAILRKKIIWRGDLDEKFPSIRMRTDRRGFQVVPALIDAGKRYSQV